ncbi:MAG: MBL fold metallo-hydrolase [candidate division KSB1 bacterium]|nr:MBL fold metallo-hydrolase [candidate division KSB1 bacterium]
MDSNFIKFLGTAGARFVVARQLRSSGGTWYNLQGMDILVDPGPGTLVKCATSKPKLDPTRLQAIILTHKHLDHSTDINVMIEAMTDGGLKKRGWLFAPEDALENDPVVLQYSRQFPEKVILLREGQSYTLADQLCFSTPIKHKHGVETYGLKFETNLGVISQVVDTAYFKELEQAYAHSDILILHVVRFKDLNDKEKEILHLNVEDARRLIASLKPRQAILTHFGMTMLRAKPWEVAQQLSRETGVEVVAANDGLKLDLEKP